MTAGALNRLLDDSQTHAAGFQLVARLQRLEQFKDTFVIFRCDSGTIIAHAKLNLAFVLPSTDLHMSIQSLAVLDGVANEIAQHRLQWDALGVEDRHRFLDHELKLGGRRLQFKDGPHERASLYLLRCMLDATRTRLGEQVVQQPLHSLHTATQLIQMLL